MTHVTKEQKRKEKTHDNVNYVYFPMTRQTNKHTQNPQTSPNAHFFTPNQICKLSLIMKIPRTIGALLCLIALILISIFICFPIRIHHHRSTHLVPTAAALIESRRLLLSSLSSFSINGNKMNSSRSTEASLRVAPPSKSNPTQNK